MSRAGRVDLPGAGAGSAARVQAAGSGPADLGYFEHSRSPLVSLAFVLPLVIVYELGTNGQSADGFRGAPHHVIAFTLMRRFFGLFGAHASHLPAMAVCGVLLAWHLARKDPWKVRWHALGGIAAEGIVLCVPLIAMSAALAHLFRGLPLAATSLPSKDLLVLCLGAGIYEELVFRLILLTILSLVVKDLLLFPAKATGLVAVLLSAVAFASYHYLGSETFQWATLAGWRTFAFRTLAGIYFGALFLTRGFGVTAATHAAYDILVLLVLP